VTYFPEYVRVLSDPQKNRTVSVSDPPPVGPTVTLRLRFQDSKLGPEDYEGRVLRTVWKLQEDLHLLFHLLVPDSPRPPSPPVQHSVHILSHGLPVLPVLSVLPTAP
jgi:hypothetical protein